MPSTSPYGPRRAGLWHLRLRPDHFPLPAPPPGALDLGRRARPPRRVDRRRGRRRGRPLQRRSRPLGRRTPRPRRADPQARGTALLRVGRAAGPLHRRSPDERADLLPEVIEGVVLPLLDPEAIARAVHDPRACAVWIAAADAIRSALDLARDASPAPPIAPAAFTTSSACSPTSRPPSPCSGIAPPPAAADGVALLGEDSWRCDHPGVLIVTGFLADAIPASPAPRCCWVPPSERSSPRSPTTTSRRCPTRRCSTPSPAAPRSGCSPLRAVAVLLSPTDRRRRPRRGGPRAPRPARPPALQHHRPPGTPLVRAPLPRRRDHPRPGPRGRLRRARLGRRARPLGPLPPLPPLRRPAPPRHGLLRRGAGALPGALPAAQRRRPRVPLLTCHYRATSSTTSLLDLRPAPLRRRSVLSASRSATWLGAR